MTEKQSAILNAAWKRKETNEFGLHNLTQNIHTRFLSTFSKSASMDLIHGRAKRIREGKTSKQNASGWGDQATYFIQREHTDAGGHLL